jgi:hypothetical protein
MITRHHFITTNSQIFKELKHFSFYLENKKNIMTSSTTFPIWNIDQLKPDDATGQLLSNTYITDGQRNLPDLEPGFKVHVADNITTPIPSLFSSETPLRWKTTPSSNFERTIQSDLHLGNRGMRGEVYGETNIIDVSSTRNTSVNADGVSMNGTPPPPPIHPVRTQQIRLGRPRV